jgi:outer membrane protein assembly factor BamD
MVMSAFTNYRQGQLFTEAINTATRYLSLYPNDEDAAYAQYIVGLSYYRQIPEVTRDQRDLGAGDAAFTGDRALSRLEYVEDSQAKLRYARDQLAGKEMQVGRYYQERKEYVAAANRYRLVVEQYPNTRQSKRRWRVWSRPTTRWGWKAKPRPRRRFSGTISPTASGMPIPTALSATGGLEPRENKGSWISRAGARLVGA